MTAPSVLAQKRCALLLAGFMIALATTCAITSARWIGTTFPGFFIMDNRVIASVSLPSWEMATQQDLYHHYVLSVNGRSVATAADLYAAVRVVAPGTPVTYEIDKNGQRSQVTLPARVFTTEDYSLLFLAYLFTGLTIALTGIGVWFLQPATSASLALCIAGVATGIFGITGADLYGPHWFFRLHVLGEAVFSAGYLHLALVFPNDHWHPTHRRWLGAPYVVAGALAVAHQVFLYQPSFYSFIHNLCMIYVGIAGASLLLSMIWNYRKPDSALARQRIRVIGLGFLGGYGLPVALMFMSGVTGGEVAVNYMAFTGVLFPLSIGYAIIKHDLFDIDALLKRAVYYLVLTVILMVSYIALLAGLNFLLHTSDLTRSPFFPLGFIIAVVLFLNPLKDHLQSLVDRLFFRLSYDPQKVLERTGEELASTLLIDQILSLIWDTIRENLGVHQGKMFLLTPDRQRYVCVYPRSKEEELLPITPDTLRLVRQHRNVMTPFDLDRMAVSSAVPSESFRFSMQNGVQLLVFMRFKNEPVGILALGRKESGKFFSAADRDFLVALANQGAFSVANAFAYQEIQALNASLEQKVTERTQELAWSNREVHEALTRLEQAYQDLQRSQDNLVRAERMAALGRLTAGIAHEMNTPLGATLTALKLLERLVAEHRAASASPDTARRPLHEVDAEIEKLLHSTQQWMDKAASYIRSLKLHTRNFRSSEKRPFSVLQVVEETVILIEHRLRLGRCTVVVSSTAKNPILHGDPGKLGQVLTNLLNNAIDAYLAVKADNGVIRLDVAEDGDTLEICIADRGCGIAPESSDHIFNEFFSTKPLGEGTGLGLSISQDIIANFFDGTIHVASTPGQGSIFTLRLSRHAKRSETHSRTPVWTPPVPNEEDPALSAQKEAEPHSP